MTRWPVMGLRRLSPPALRRTRSVGIILLGVLLLVLPTIFTVFPGLTNLPQGSRIAILLAWALIALVVGWVAKLADDELHQNVEHQMDAIVVSEHRVLLTQRLSAILGTTALPAQYNLTLYVPTPDGEFLLPVFPRAVGPSDPTVFAKGAGATGEAWESAEADEVTVVTGRAVSDARHRLTAEQQRIYRSYAVVAAVLVTDDESGERLGVLTALARRDDGYFDGEEGQRALIDLADEVSWLMPQVVRWMLPTEEEIGP